MEWVVSNWGFVSGVGLIVLFIAGVGWQTKRNAKDIKMLQESTAKAKELSDLEKHLNDKIEEQRAESQRYIDKIFLSLDDMRKAMADGFNRLDDRIFGLLKSNKE